MELGDEDLLRYSNKIESVGLRKYPHPLVIAMVTRVMTLTFQIFRDYLTFAGIGLTNAQLFEMSVGEFKQNKVSCFTVKFKIMDESRRGRGDPGTGFWDLGSRSCIIF